MQNKNAKRTFILRSFHNQMYYNMILLPINPVTNSTYYKTSG